MQRHQAVVPCGHNTRFVRELTDGLRICLAGSNDELKGAGDLGIERAPQFGLREFVGRVLRADVWDAYGFRDQICFFLICL